MDSRTWDQNRKVADKPTIPGQETDYHTKKPDEYTDGDEEAHI